MKMDDFDKIMALIASKGSKREEPPKSAEPESKQPETPEEGEAKGRRLIMLPEEIDARLDTLADLRDEANGILIYGIQVGERGAHCRPVYTSVMTGVGTPGHVDVEPERLEVVNEFLSRNKDYAMVKFHTHSRGTIKSFGSSLARNFSGGDIEGYEECLADEPRLVFMVATPETKLLYGRGDLSLKVVQDFHKAREARIHADLDEIKREKGYGFDPLTNWI